MSNLLIHTHIFQLNFYMILIVLTVRGVNPVQRGDSSFLLLHNTTYA